ncbi:MAG TPA: hypothetical protein VEW93_15440 [Acidimicrobiales bacterium]|nr:hypothetical protein [Acidimicrobiales bacterium]
MRRTLTVTATVLLLLAAAAACGDDGDGAEATTTTTGSTTTTGPTTTTGSTTTEGPTSTGEDEPGGPGPDEEAVGVACLEGEMEVVTVESQGDIPGLSGSETITATGTSLHLAVPEEGTWVMGGTEGGKLDIEVAPGVTGTLAVAGALIGSYTESDEDEVRFEVDEADGTATATVEGGNFGPVPLDELADLFSPEGEAEVACAGDEVTIDTDGAALVLRRLEDTPILDGLDQ